MTEDFEKGWAEIDRKINLIGKLMTLKAEMDAIVKEINQPMIEGVKDGISAINQYCKSFVICNNKCKFYREKAFEKGHKCLLMKVPSTWETDWVDDDDSE